MLRPEIAARNSNFVNYANGNLASQAQLDPKVRDDKADLSDAGDHGKALHDHPRMTPACSGR
jgi:spermidine/putrescine-binding protein